MEVKQSDNTEQESYTRHLLASLQVLCMWRTNNSNVAVASCLCFSVTQFSSVAPQNCLVLQGKKVLNYTHPWREVINFAAEFL